VLSPVDQRIRALVVDIVETSPSAPPFAEIEAHSHTFDHELQTQHGRGGEAHAWPAAATAAATAIVVVGLSLVAVWLVGSRSSGPATTPLGVPPSRVVRLPLRSVPEGVTARTLRGTPVFLVRNKSHVTTFLTRTDQSPGQRALAWCPSAHVFATPTLTAVFDSQGHAIQGPDRPKPGLERRGLSRLATTVDSQTVNIDIARVIPDRQPPHISNSPLQGVPPCPGAILSGGYQQPAGPPVATLEVDALGTLKFQQSVYTVPAGTIQINFVSRDGNHTLLFDDPRFSGFELQVPALGTVTGKVTLKPGTYIIYCIILGHRQAGMQATIIAQ
jgi:plastocyanin